MILYDAAMLALARGRGIRRPSMPEGLIIVPVAARNETDSMKAFLAMTGDQKIEWRAEIADMVAEDWETADWRQVPGKVFLSCG